MKLVVTEKPSVGRDIASVLQLSGRKTGYIEGPHWTVTWALGHLVELREPHEYDPAWKSWSLDVLPMVPEPFQLRPRGDKGAKAQLKVVRDLMRQADEIVCATDAGREGELIFRYLLQYAKCTRKPVRRLWISSLTTRAIQEGFRNLRPGSEFDPLYQAARCRSEADWIVGLNGTRYFTVAHGTGRQLWSVGRVQTPILALVVTRDLEIEHFDPEDYWELHTLYREARFKHRAEKAASRFASEEEARAVRDRVSGHDLEITDVQDKKERVLPPLLYDLTNLQKDMNKRYGLTADATLKAAQSLYERKYLTYPRTDSRCLTSDMADGIPALLEALRPRFGEAVSRLDPGQLTIGKRIVNDAKVGDHHAIIPTEVLPRDLGGNEAQVYEAVALQFIGIFYPPCIKGVTTVEAQANSEPFRARGTVILDPGWQVLHPGLQKAQAKQAEQILPVFEAGERGPHAPEVKALQTKPPKRFTEGTLLNLMETAGKTVEEEALQEALKDRGIGTPATRAAIIETLIRRSYLEREKKNLLSTPAGRHLVGLVRDERLKSAELTGEWEARLKQIEKGQGDPEAFLQDVVSYTTEIVQRPAEVGGLGHCPRCRREIIEGRRGYGCSGYKEGCDFVLWKEQFGAAVSPAMARAILGAGSTLAPLRLQVDGREVTGHIVVRDGQVAWTEAKGEAVAAGEQFGTCPVCGGAVVESKKAYGCANWRQGCKFTIWKTMAKKKISAAMAKTLLSKGETAVLKGFVSRQGKKFDAKLKVVDGEVKFDFPPRES